MYWQELPGQKDKEAPKEADFVQVKVPLYMKLSYRACLCALPPKDQKRRSQNK